MLTTDSTDPVGFDALPLISTDDTDQKTIGI